MVSNFHQIEDYHDCYHYDIATSTTSIIAILTLFNETALTTTVLTRIVPTTTSQMFVSSAATAPTTATIAFLLYITISAY